MVFFEANSIRCQDWDNLHFNAKQIKIPTETRWNLIVLFAVVFVHIGVLGYLFQWRQIANSKVDMLHDALQIDFIERIIEPNSEAELSDVAKNITAQKARSVLVTDTHTKTQPTDDKNIVLATSLRLTLDKDEWNTEPVIAERNPMKRQSIVLAGRAEPFVKGIKLRDKLTPEQKLSMIGKLLFAAVDYDPCAEARRRVAIGQSQLNEIDLKADLSTIENHCSP